MDLRALYVDVTLVFHKEADQVLWQLTSALAKLGSIISVPTFSFLRLAIAN